MGHVSQIEALGGISMRSRALSRPRTALDHAQACSYTYAVRECFMLCSWSSMFCASDPGCIQSENSNLDKIVLISKYVGEQEVSIQEDGRSEMFDAKYA